MSAKADLLTYRGIVKRGSRPSFRFSATAVVALRKFFLSQLRFSSNQPEPSNSDIKELLAACSASRDLSAFGKRTTLAGCFSAADSALRIAS